ncbi:MAG: PIN domain-containing protein [Chitinophagaceae bacterium]|nr:PIN domain-containing protein [Rubrivivax sp.]
MACAPCAAPAMVLDTNATLDWLLFGNPGMNAIKASIQSGQVRWISCSRMRVELACMLFHPRLAAWGGDRTQALAVFDRWTQACPEPCDSRPSGPRCSDPNDQVFVDLALVYGARWLVTHDRALLKLARALRHRVAVVRPGDWHEP